jgi:hypothetical protein
MPLPALLLRVLPQFRGTIDGLVFGITAGVGFALAEGVVSYWSIFSYPPGQSDPSFWIYPITSLALLIPVLHGSTAGAITATLWRPSRGGSGRWVSFFGVPIVLLAVIAFYGGGQILANHGVGQLIVLLYQAALILLVLLYIRHLVHHSLMEEGQDMDLRPIVCPHCHHHVMAGGFCPSCGAALDASPRRETGLLPAQPAPAATADSQ